METHTSYVDPSAPPSPTPPKRPRGRPRKPVKAPAAPPNQTQIEIERDLDVCTKEELLTRWDSRQATFEKWVGKPLAEAVKDHNPIFYLATKCWFDNPRAKDNPAFLYPPYHRDVLCARAIGYILAPSDTSDGFLFLGPRDTYKSTFVAVIAMWFALRKKHLEATDARIVLRHHKEKMAARTLRKVKAKFWHHPYVRAYWTEYCPPEDSRDFGTKTEFSLFNASEGYEGEETFRAIGMTASDTGSHSDLDLGDDLVTEEHINSKAVREEVKLMYEAKQFTRDTVSGKEANFGTPYHVNDLWGSMEKANVEGEANYQIVKVSAMADKCQCGHGEVLHPATDTTPLEIAPCVAPGCKCGRSTIFAHPFRLTKAFLDKKMQSELSRTGRIVLWYLQYQCQVRLGGQVVADKSWLRYVHHSDVSPNAWRVMHVDGAWKGTKNSGEGDCASIQVWAIERRGPLLLRTLIDGVHSNEFTSLDGEREMFRLMRKYGVIDVTIEELGGYAFRTAIDTAATSRGVMLNQIELINKQMHKVQREATFLKEMQAGRVFISHECDPTLKEAFIDQVLDFPQLQHDDALDCAAQETDPAVLESYAPMWNTSVGAHPFHRPVEVAPRTRHCAS